MQKKNILFLVNSFRFGGAEKQIIDLFNGLDRSEFNLFLCYLKNDETLLDQINTAYIERVFCGNVRKKIDFSTASNLVKYVDKNQISTVLCTNLYPMIYGVLIKLFSKNPIRLIEVLHTTELLNAYEKFKLPLYRMLFRAYYQVIFVSERQRQYWLNTMRLGVGKAITVHNGVNLIRFISTENDLGLGDVQKELNLTREDFTLGICAALRPEKRHIDIVAAVAELVKQRMPVRLLIIGDGPERKNIENKIEAYCLQDRVIITGFRKDVRPYIRICDCMVMASTAIETFSIAILESMAMSKPIISTDIGGAAEQIEHGVNGYLYEKGEVNQMVRYVKKMIIEKNSRAMGNKSREKVAKEFSLQKMIAGYSEVLR